MKSLLLLPALLLASVHAGPILFQVTDLGTLGGAGASANAINRSGATAGAAINIYGDSRATSGSTDITPAGASQAIAASINAAGHIAGTTYINGMPHATVWTNGVARYLPALGGADSYAMGINNADQVTGMAITGLGFGHAFLNTTDIGVMPGGSWSSGYAINGTGQIAGYGDTALGSFRGFLWSAGAGFTQLGTLGGSNSYAMALNAAGQAAGSAQAHSGLIHAVLFQGSTLLDLGTLGGSSSYGYGINAAGAVVGYSLTAANLATHAFLYSGGAMLDLNQLLASPGWELQEAYGINDAGQIAGSGLFHGLSHAFRLDPIAPPQQFSVSTAVPEPAPAAICGVLLLLLLRRAQQARVKQAAIHRR